MLWPYVVAVVVLAAILGWLRNHRPRDRFAELVALCRGDVEQAERLVGREQQRFPDRARDQHVARAIDALVADRSR